MYVYVYIYVCIQTLSSAPCLCSRATLIFHPYLRWVIHDKNLPKKTSFRAKIQLRNLQVRVRCHIPPLQIFPWSTRKSSQLMLFWAVVLSWKVPFLARTKHLCNPHLYRALARHICSRTVTMSDCGLHGPASWWPCTHGKSHYMLIRNCKVVPWEPIYVSSCFPLSSQEYVKQKQAFQAKIHGTTISSIFKNKDFQAEWIYMIQVGLKSREIQEPIGRLWMWLIEIWRHGHLPMPSKVLFPVCGCETPLGHRSAPKVTFAPWA